MSFDIDIDIPTRIKTLPNGIVRAMIYDEENQKIRAHPSGVYDSYYVHKRIDPVTNLVTVDYKKLESVGINKIDLLKNSSYDGFRTREEILECANREPNWKLLENENFVSGLPHIGNNFDLVSLLKPSSIHDLADLLALMRPGKLHLLNTYLENKNAVRLSLYKKPNNDKHYFKKSHAYAYAKMIIALMNKQDQFSISY